MGCKLLKIKVRVRWIAGLELKARLTRDKCPLSSEAEKVAICRH